MGKENNTSAHGPFGKGEFNVYSTLKNQVDRLMPKADLFGPEAKKFEKEKRAVLAEKEHELSSLSEKLPEWISPAGQYLAQMAWLVLTEKAALPRSARAGEVQHIYGPIGVLASAMAKSEAYQEPKLEIHLTACPSYINENDWKEESTSPDPVFVYKHINWKKIKDFCDWIGSLETTNNNNKLIKGIYLHSPGPTDLAYVDRFPGLFGIFGNLKGHKSAEVHWGQMEEIAKYCGLPLVSDVDYLLSEAFRLGVDMEKITQCIEERDAAKFVQSRYIYDAYVKWGAKAKSVLEIFYLGSIIGYGNPEASFSPDSPDLLKLYINCEEGWSPETFAGAKTGVDFRHLLKDKGFHLALLIGSIQTPWAGKE